MAKFKAGDKAYIVESNRLVREVTIVRFLGGMYLIRFEGGGGIQVKEHRLFVSEEDALESIHLKPEETSKKISRTPYDYM